MSNQIPSLQWLQEINKTLSAQGVLPEKRQYQAYRLWCMESGQSSAFGGETAKFISDWFATNTLSASAIRRSSARTVFYFDMSFIELTIPIVFGTVAINPLDMTRNVPMEVVKQISDNELIQADLLQSYQKAFNCFVAFAGTSSTSPIQRDKTLAKAAYKHITAACAQLLESPPNTKALQDCRFAVEIALKAILVNKLGTDEKTFKFKLSHNFDKLFGYAGQHNVPMPVELTELEIFPDVGARYDILDIDRYRLWAGYSIALTCLNYTITELTGEQCSALK